MAVIDYLVHLDLNQNELQNAVIQVLGSAPSGVQGQIYYDSTAAKKQPYFHDGTSFKAFLPNGDKGDITVTTTTVEGDTWTIDAGAVTLSKFQDIATNRFLGRITAGSGVVEELTMPQATSMLNLFSTSTTAQGLVPGSNGATTTFLRADGTWAAPVGGFTSFDVGADVNANQTINSLDLLDLTSSGPIETTVTKATTTVTVDFAITAASLTNSLLATMAANTVKVNATAGVATPTDFALTTNEVLGRLGGNIVGIDIIDDDTFGTATASNIATAESIKTYVDNAVLGGMTYKGAFDPTAGAGAGSPDLDAITSEIGDTYTVTVAGTYNWTTGSAVLEIGDTLIAEADGVLNDVADWTIVQRNIDNPTDTYSTTFGNGALTTFTINHNLNNTDVVVRVIDDTSKAQVICDTVNTDANNVQINVNTAPTAAQYRAIVIG